MSLKTFTAAASLLLLAACGDSSVPTIPVPNFAGSYGLQWQVQFHRNHDNFEGSYFCYGTLTMAQSSTGRGEATLNGFVVIQGGCPQGTFDLTGSVRSNGAITLRTVGPRPNEGQCPFAMDTVYSGLVSEASGGSYTLSARATTLLNCPGPGEGEHRFDYVIQGWK